MSTAMPANTVPSATRGWAISALILGILYLLMSALSLTQIRSNPMIGQHGAFYVIISAADVLTAVAFVASGAATLKGREWGRETLAYAAAAAIVLTLLGMGMQWVMMHDPNYARTMLNMLTAKSPQFKAMPPDQLQHIISLQVTVGLWAGIAFALVQIVYNILLYRHMSADTPVAAASV